MMPYMIVKCEHSRFWNVMCEDRLVCKTVYKQGAVEVAAELNQMWFAAINKKVA